VLRENLPYNKAMNKPPTTEERIWAVLSHLSALAFGMGILLPIIGWSEQRWKSKYASFQCLQALGYQSLGYTVWLLSYLVVLIAALIVVIVVSFQAERNGMAFNPLTGPMAFLLYGFIFGFFALYMLLPIFAAISCAFGKDFRYSILGNRLAKYLGYQRTEDDSPRLVEEHEDRWVAAMGHFSVIIVLWGLMAPLAAWITQGRKNPFLKFQSIQTLIYQALPTLLYIAAMFIALLGVSALTLTVGLNETTGNNTLVGIGIFFAFSLIASFILLIIPLFHILGQWAGYRVLKGDDYHYPVVGRLVERWMENKTTLAAVPRDASRTAA
jgi:uncharacterized Tic20 family protein